MNKIGTAVNNYFSDRNVSPNGLKFALFDMDGVLYDSMPAHAKAWKQTMEEIGIECELVEFYEYEGQTAKKTVNILFERSLGRNASEKELSDIYHRKTELFIKYNNGNLIPDINRVLTSLCQVKKTIVTGSSQPSLIDKIGKDFNTMFDLDAMVTGKDVKFGKPMPEPYLKGLGNLNAKNFEAIVVENAPMGIRSAVSAGIFTIAINTGIIGNDVLERENPNLLYNNMLEFCNDIPQIINEFSKKNH